MVDFVQNHKLQIKMHHSNGFVKFHYIGMYKFNRIKRQHISITNELKPNVSFFFASFFQIRNRNAHGASMENTFVNYTFITVTNLSI